MKRISLFLCLLTLALPMSASAVDLCARRGSPKVYAVGGDRLRQECRDGDERYSPPAVERTLRFCTVVVQANQTSYALCHCEDDEQMEKFGPYESEPSNLYPDIKSTMYLSGVHDFDPVIKGYWYAAVEVVAPQSGRVWLVLQCARNQ
ncbi:MAG: hypothetical protein WC817_01275 [Patescibacteria group bacterium]|jgi:hypothetical protein